MHLLPPGQRIAQHECTENIRACLLGVTTLTTGDSEGTVEADAKRSKRLWRRRRYSLSLGMSQFDDDEVEIQRVLTRRGLLNLRWRAHLTFVRVSSCM